MNNFFEELKKYFEVTPQNKILEDWAKSAEFDKIGPTVDDFLHITRQHFQIQSEEPLSVCLATNNEYSSKFTSGFFMSNQNILLCKKPHFLS